MFFLWIAVQAVPVTNQTIAVAPGTAYIATQSRYPTQHPPIVATAYPVAQGAPMQMPQPWVLSLFLSSWCFDGLSFSGITVSLLLQCRCHSRTYSSLSKVILSFKLSFLFRYVQGMPPGQFACPPPYDQVVKDPYQQQSPYNPHYTGH